MTRKQLLLAALGIVSMSGAFVSATSYAETQGMDRRDDRSDTRQDSRDEKQECRAGDENSRAECRQDKRDTKQDARGPGDEPDVDVDMPEAGDSED